MADSAERIIGKKGLSDKIYDYASRGYTNAEVGMMSKYG